MRGIPCGEYFCVSETVFLTHPMQDEGFHPAWQGRGNNFSARTLRKISPPARKSRTRRMNTKDRPPLMAARRLDRNVFNRLRSLYGELLGLRCHPFTPPMAMPSTNCFCRKMYRVKGNRNVRVAPAMTMP